MSHHPARKARYGHRPAALATLVAALLAVVAAGSLAAPARAAVGNVAWADVYERHGSADDYYAAVAATATGAVYCVGASTTNQSPAADVLVRKLTIDGHVSWTRNWTRVRGSNDRGLAAALDGRGDLVVAGSSGDAGLVMKYAPNGRLLWWRRYTRDPQARFGDVALGADGSICLAGSSGGSGGARILTVKYSRRGRWLWKATYGSAGRDAYGRALALDGSGNAYVTGSFAVSPTASKCVTLKYDAQGRIRWDGSGRGYPDTPSGQTSGKDVVVRGGAIFVVGDTESDGFVLKYTTGGGSGYQARWTSPAGLGDQFTALSVDGGGSAYVTGYYATASEDEMMTVCFDGAGNESWAAPLSGQAARGRTLSMDGLGNVYAASSAQGFRVDSDTGLGLPRWNDTWSGPTNDEYDPNASVAVTGKAVFVAGRVHSVAGGDGAAVVCFAP